MKKEYKKHIIKKLSLEETVLTDVENRIIDIGYDLFAEKLQDIKLLNDEIKRLSIENANLKAYQAKD